MRRRSRAVEGGRGRWRVLPLVLVALSSTALHRLSPPSTAQNREVLLATTTSTRDAGPPDSLLPVFARQTGHRVRVIAVGSGPAPARTRRPAGAAVGAAAGVGWYIESGQGMAATLQMADEKRGYTITDRATYLAWRDKLQLVPEVEGDSLLYNVYHVMEVNPKNAPRVNTAGGKTLADFLVAPETQALIGAFGKSRFGQSLFMPDAGKPDHW